MNYDPEDDYDPMMDDCDPDPLTGQPFGIRTIPETPMRQLHEEINRAGVEMVRQAAVGTPEKKAVSVTIQVLKDWMRRHYATGVKSDPDGQNIGGFRYIDIDSLETFMGISSSALSKEDEANMYSLKKLWSWLTGGEKKPDPPPVVLAPQSREKKKYYCSLCQLQDIPGVPGEKTVGERVAFIWDAEEERGVIERVGRVRSDLLLVRTDEGVLRAVKPHACWRLGPPAKLVSPVTCPGCGMSTVIEDNRCKHEDRHVLFTDTALRRRNFICEVCKAYIPTKKDGERLNPDEERMLTSDPPICPDCCHMELLEGPHGGDCVNVKCGNEDCGSKFNVMFMFGIERISDAQPNKRRLSQIEKDIYKS